jgi:hypothetical protein
MAASQLPTIGLAILSQSTRTAKPAANATAISQEIATADPSKKSKSSGALNPTIIEMINPMIPAKAGTAQLLARAGTARAMPPIIKPSGPNRGSSDDITNCPPAKPKAKTTKPATRGSNEVLASAAPAASSGNDSSRGPLH